MSTLNDLAFSQTGAERDHEVQLKNRMMADIAMADVKMETPSHIMYKLVNKTGSGKVHVDGLNDVINPKTKRPDRIWLLRGASSIWESEIGDKIKDKEYVAQNKYSLVFDRNGVLRVATSKPLEVEFAETCTHNVKNGQGSKMAFYKYDPSSQEKAMLEKEMNEMEMVLAVKDMSKDSLERHASYLGVNFLDELGNQKTEEGLRRDVMIRAKRNPDGFKAILNTKEVEIAYTIKKAILDGKIDIGSKPGLILWAKGGGTITRLPGGRKPLEYLVEMATDSTNKEGKQFLEQLKGLNQ